MVEFWRAKGRLGTLAEMLEASLSERLRETNPVHGRKDPLDAAGSWQALEQIGAALTFGRANTVTTPSQQVATVAPASALDLSNVLPDWSREHCLRLLMRPAFDLATLGRVRLHNDNEGVVRGYLAARWLKRLRNANCPYSIVRDLLFADVYGLKLVKELMREVAAWLSLWDEAVAGETLARDPLVLLSNGDPGSLSATMRARVLQRIVEALAVEHGKSTIFDPDSVRRFTTPELGELGAGAVDAA